MMRRGKAHAVAIAALMALTLLVCGDVLFSSKPVMFSILRGDIWAEDIYWRGFAFGELRNGNFPLWNPHINSGQPFFGGGQSGMLYPPNLMYLIMPVYRAINWTIALHLFLIGAFMYAWVTFLRLRPLPAFLSAALLMLSGAYFMNIFAGHLGPVAGMAWIPLLFLCVDGAIRRPGAGWMLLGIFAGTMQITAGAPQYVLMTGVAGAIYAGLRIKESKRALLSVGLMAGMALGAVAICGVEVLTTIAATASSTRADGVPLEFARLFSFPPENLITFVAPHFFGNILESPYWGRCLLWEMLPSIGVTGFALAVYGGFRKRRRRWVAPVMCVIMLILALGRHTPLHGLLYDFVPGFNSIRGMSKFTFFLTMFLCLMAGDGFQLAARRRFNTGLLVAAAVGCVIMMAIGIWLITFPAPLAAHWERIVQWLHESGESNAGDMARQIPNFVRGSAEGAGGSLVLSSMALMLLGVALAAQRWKRKAVYAVAAVLLAEALLYSMGMKPTISFDQAIPPLATEAAARLGPDDRCLLQERADVAMLSGWGNIWGYGPFVSKRYMELMALTQGEDPRRTVQFVEFSKLHPLYRMLRCRYMLEDAGGVLVVKESQEPMPHLLLLNDYKVVRADRIRGYLLEGGIDFEKTALLEDDPFPEPSPSGAGWAKVVEKGTDYLIIEAEIVAPALLLVTDAWAKGWQARSLPGSAQEEYHVQVANYVLRAVALEAGRHRFIMEYRAPGIKAGLAITSAGVALYLAGLAYYLHRRRAQRQSAT